MEMSMIQHRIASIAGAAEGDHDRFANLAQALRCLKAGEEDVSE